eukprot:scaffold2388_cov163-Amphora_coffeaeformis.AAC.5
MTSLILRRLSKLFSPWWTNDGRGRSSLATAFALFARHHSASLDAPYTNTTTGNASAFRSARSIALYLVHSRQYTIEQAYKTVSPT